MIFKPRADEVVLILGKRGSGKTTFLKELLNLDYNFFIFDPMNRLPHLKEKKYVAGLIPRADTEKTTAYLNYIYANGNMTVIIDELDIFPYSPILAHIILTGRNKNIGVYASAHRPADVDKDYITNADWVISFNFKEPNDIEYLKRYVGASNARRIYSLNFYKHEFILLRQGNYEGTYVLKVS